MVDPGPKPLFHWVRSPVDTLAVCGQPHDIEGHVGVIDATFVRLWRESKVRICSTCFEDIQVAGLTPSNPGKIPSGNRLAVMARGDIASLVTAQEDGTITINARWVGDIEWAPEISPDGRALLIVGINEALRKFGPTFTDVRDITE